MAEMVPENFHFHITFGHNGARSGPIWDENQNENHLSVKDYSDSIWRNMQFSKSYDLFTAIHLKIFRDLAEYARFCQILPDLPKYVRICQIKGLKLGKVYFCPIMTLKLGEAVLNLPLH
jgi:hypothetical protein